MPTTTQIKQHDTGPAFTATLTDGDGNAIDLTGAAAVLLLRRTGTRVLAVTGVMTITDAAAGKVRYPWAVGDTDRCGEYDLEVQVTFADAVIETYPNNAYHKLTILKDLGP